MARSGSSTGTRKLIIRVHIRESIPLGVNDVLRARVRLSARAFKQAVLFGARVATGKTGPVGGWGLPLGQEDGGGLMVDSVAPVSSGAELPWTAVEHAVRLAAGTGREVLGLVQFGASGVQQDGVATSLLNQLATLTPVPGPLGFVLLTYDPSTTSAERFGLRAFVAGEPTRELPVEVDEVDPAVLARALVDVANAHAAGVPLAPELDEILGWADASLRREALSQIFPTEGLPELSPPVPAVPHEEVPGAFAIGGGGSWEAAEALEDVLAEGGEAGTERLNFANALESEGRQEEAAEAYAEAARELGAEGRPGPALEAAAMAGQLLLGLNQADAAAALLEAAIADWGGGSEDEQAATTLDRVAGLVKAHDALAAVYLRTQNLVGAHEHGLAACALAAKTSDPELLAGAVNNLGRVLVELREYGRAIVLLSWARAQHAALGDFYGEQVALVNLGLATLALGVEHWRLARSLFESVVSTPGGASAPDAEFEALLGLSEGEERFGDPEVAAWHARRALEVARRVDDPHAELMALRRLGHLLAWGGWPEEGAQRLKEALELARDAFDDRRAQLELHLEVAEVSVELLDAPRDALPHVEDALALAELTGDHSGRARALMVEGKARAALGDLSEAARSFRLAKDAFLELGNEAEAALCSDLLGRLG
ncbi:MAG: hypothetical protein Kow0069_31240 [Promethearchaeota archaeon]